MRTISYICTMCIIYTMNKQNRVYASCAAVFELSVFIILLNFLIFINLYNYGLAIIQESLW